MYERQPTRLLGLEAIVKRALEAKASGVMFPVRRLSRAEQAAHLQVMLDRAQVESKARALAAEAAAAVIRCDDPDSVDADDCETWPTLYRVTTFQYRQIGLQRFECTSTLFNERLSLSVRWTVQQPDTRLSAGSPLVKVSWAKLMPTSFEGCLRVDRLVVLERPEPLANLFRTIPPDWVRDRALIKHGVDLMEHLPTPIRHLFNAMFWDSGRFQRFCTGPSSMHHHHADLNGNLRHSLEVALGLRREFEEPVLNDRPQVDENCPPNRHRILSDDVSLAVMSGLLHDAGKADEYWLERDGSYAMSDRGRLLGHKLTVVEWIAAATAKWRIAIPKEHYLDLIHNITSAKGAPDWLGIRRPATLAASYLSNLDRMSGARDMAVRADDQHRFSNRY